MKAFIRLPHPHALLVALLAMVFAGATMLPVSGAETKRKKSSTKSSASSTAKKKSATSKSKPKATRSSKSTPKGKKSATPSKKKAPGKASSRSTPAKATPAPKPVKDEETSRKPGLPGQPAPDLPVREPDLSAPAPTSETSPEEEPEKALADAPNDEPKPASVVSLSPEDILGFVEQPSRVKDLIRAALDLTGEKLTYTFGSADPASGGMDCSGAIQYLLMKQGFDGVPRDASGQYVWARKNGKFFAVVSHKSDSFEFGDLLPGDLLFWNGTYDVDRDPPVTHTMIYLGVQRKRAQHVMWGSSDGRTYDNKPRCGVSVFDFKMPGADKNIADGAKADFLGYARIPGLRE